MAETWRPERPRKRYCILGRSFGASVAAILADYEVSSVQILSTTSVKSPKSPNQKNKVCLNKKLVEIIQLTRKNGNAKKYI